MLRHPHDLDAPILNRGALVAQALEWNADLDLEAARGDSALRFVDVVGVQIDDAVKAAARVSPTRGAGNPLTADAVLLRAQRIDGKEERAAPIVERVEQDLNVVVGSDVVAVGEGRPHHVAVLLEGTDAEVDRIGCVEDEDLRRILSRPAVHGAILTEAREQCRLSPHILVEHAVDVDRGLDPRHAHVELTEVAVVHLLLGADGLDDEESDGEHGTKLMREKGDGRCTVR